MDGHILDFTVPKYTTVEYDITPEFHMILPTSGAFTGADLSQDLTAELIRGRKVIPFDKKAGFLKKQSG